MQCTDERAGGLNLLGSHLVLAPPVGFVPGGNANDVRSSRKRSAFEHSDSRSECGIDGAMIMEVTAPYLRLCECTKRMSEPLSGQLRAAAW